jgi:hypothetical protein
MHHGPEQLHNFLSHLSSLSSFIHFTMEIESDSAIPFQDILFIRKETTLATKVHRKSTHAGWYLKLKFNHLPHVKRSLVQSLHNRASTICQEQDLFNEISSLRSDLHLSGYPQVSRTQLLIPKLSVIQIKRKSLWALCISHMWWVFQRSSNL